MWGGLENLERKKAGCEIKRFVDTYMCVCKKGMRARKGPAEN